MSALSRRRIVIAAAFAVCLFGGTLAVVRWRAARSEPMAVPEPDLSTAHVEVARAIHAAQEEVRGNPGSALSWGRLGRVLMAHEIDDSALDCFRHAARLDPRQFHWPYYAARLEEGRHPESALADYEHAVALDPRYAPLQWRLAMVLMKLGRCDEAEPHFREAARLADKSPFPWLGLGRVALSRGDRGAARAHFEEAATRAPRDQAAQIELARICFLVGDIEAASAHRENIARLPPSVPEMPDPVLQSIDQLKAGVLKLSEQADYLAARGDLAASADAYRALIRARPELAGPRLSLGMTLERQGDIAGAAEIFREAAGQFPNDSLVTFRLARSLESLDDVDGAIEAYRQCLAAKPDHAQAWHGLGLLLKRRNDLPGALSALREAVDSDPHSAAAHLSLGMLLEQSGDLDRAIEHLQSAVQLAPDDAAAQARLRKARDKRESLPPSGSDPKRGATD